MRRVVVAVVAVVLAATLAGCTARTGTVKWVDWISYQYGGDIGTCRVGMTNIVTEDGKRLKFGETHRVKKVTKRWCFAHFKKGQRKTYE